MNPGPTSHAEDTAPLYQPLFEVIAEFNEGEDHSTMRRKKEDWVERLYYPKPDFGVIFQHEHKTQKGKKSKKKKQGSIEEGLERQRSLDDLLRLNNYGERAAG